MVKKFIFWGFWGLIGLEIGLALAYLGMVIQFGEAFHWLDFDGLRSLPSLMQAALLLGIGLLSCVILAYRRRLHQPLSVFLPLAIATLCFYGSLDEMVKLHLVLREYNWQFIYISILIAIPLMGWRDLSRLWQYQRSTVVWVLAGISIFLLGGFGAEMLKDAIALEVAAHASERAMFYSEHLRITVEESAELLGESVIFYALVRFLYPVWGLPAAKKRY